MFMYMNRAPRHAHEGNEPIWVVYNLLKLITNKTVNFKTSIAITIL